METPRGPARGILLLLCLVLLLPWGCRSRAGRQRLQKERLAMAERANDEASGGPEERAAIAARHDRFEKSKGGEIHRQHPEWSEQDCTVLSSNMVLMGMRPDQIKYVFGDPVRITPESDGERWSMSDGRTLVFRNGVLKEAPGSMTFKIDPDKLEPR